MRKCVKCKNLNEKTKDSKIIKMKLFEAAAVSTSFCGPWASPEWEGRKAKKYFVAISNGLGEQIRGDEQCGQMFGVNILPILQKIAQNVPNLWRFGPLQ